jgi:prevent-host-death family protein
MKSALGPVRRRSPRNDKNISRASARGRGGSGRENSYTATEAKNEFGRLLDQALQGITVVITKHDAPRAVLLSVDRFHALQQAPQINLNQLTAEFDAALARMQTPTSRAGMERAFNASAKALGKAALTAARKRG